MSFPYLLFLPFDEVSYLWSGGYLTETYVNLIVLSIGFAGSGIESKEARISSLRSAMAETFPEPNRRLLQRYVTIFINSL